MIPLKIGGVASGSLAVLHLLIIIWGGPAYRYFGAGERMAQLADHGSAWPALLTAAVGVMFAAWAAYAFSGAGLLRRIPFLRTALVLIGSAYVVRGALIGPQLLWWFEGYREAVPARQLLFSLLALVTGLAYLEGTRVTWAGLGRVERGGARLARRRGAAEHDGEGGKE